MKLESEIIESLINIDFLSHCKSLNSNFELIADLNVAGKGINSLEWENLCLKKIGDLTSYLSKHYRDLYKKNWNNLAMEIKKSIIPIVEKKLDYLINDGKLLENMKDQILFDIMNIALADSYSSLYTSEFYDYLYQIYLSGYIPCGWSGEYPNGNIKVL